MEHKRTNKNFPQTQTQTQVYLSSMKNAGAQEKEANVRRGNGKTRKNGEKMKSKKTDKGG
jgi:hypothetical protein